jgi:hypothetical protein
MAILAYRDAFGPAIPQGIKKAQESFAMQVSRNIALAMFQYANDNDGHYPDGDSSTEVFQKLIDGNYVSDPAIFYLPMDGKTPGQRGERLKPENVCFDVTGGVTSSSPDRLPLVFLTGYKVDYQPGGKAVSLTSPYPPFQSKERSWWQWLFGEPRQPLGPFIAVCYHSNNAFIRPVDTQSSRYGEALDFMPKDFNAHGQTFRQLTPTGVLK